MSLGKAFGISILAFIVFNFTFFLIGYGISGMLPLFFQSIATYPSNILLMFLGPIIAGQFPLILTSEFTMWLAGFPVVPADIVLFIGYIVAPIGAAYLSGRYGDNKREAFLGWFLTAMISAIIVLIGGTIELVIAGAPYQIIISQVIGSISIGLVYGLACGCIPLLISRETY